MKVKGGEKRKGWEKEGMFRGEIMVEVGKGRSLFFQPLSLSLFYPSSNPY
jgi:hypothetical protein